MTSSDYIMTMLEVRIADLKARLSEYLRQVRNGEVLTVLDRNTPIARVIPHEKSPTLASRRPPAGSRIQDVALPPPLKLGVDLMALLAEERQSSR